MISDFETRHRGSAIQSVRSASATIAKPMYTVSGATFYLRDHPCIDCGQSDPSVLDFDHVRGIKSAAISSMVRDVRSMDVIWSEVAKCEIRCANCHRRRTAATLWGKANETAKPMHVVDAQEGLAPTASH